MAVNTRQNYTVLVPILHAVAISENGVRLRLLTFHNGKSRNSAM